MSYHNKNKIQFFWRNFYLILWEKVKRFISLFLANFCGETGKNWEIFINFHFYSFYFQNTELLVLSCLKWDVSCVTPLDFLELLITRLPIQNKNCKNILPETIRKHSQAYISLAIKGKWSLLFIGQCTVEWDSFWF